MASKNQKVIIEELAKVGLKPHAIAGIMANLEHENGFNTTVNNGDGGAASGIAQWHPDRFARVIRIAKKMGVKPTDIRAQARTLALSIKDENQSGKSGTTTVDSLNKLGNPAAVAKFFDENYERSSGSTTQSRMNAAKNYVKMSNRYASGETPAQPQAKVPGSKNGKMTWVPKVGNQVSQDFTGPGNYASGNHSGVDVPGGAGGQPIRWAPPVSGKVIKIGSTGAYGNHVVIRDENKRDWLLAHMRDAPLVSVGDRIEQGTEIGRVGETGNARGAHLHIEQTRPGVKWVSGQDVKRAKLVFKVGTNGQVYDEDFKPVKGDYLEAIGLSGQALGRKGNEELEELVKRAANKEWTNTEFTRQFKKTQWYIDRAQSQREFDMLQDTEQQQLIKQNMAKADRGAMQYGVELSPEDKRKLAIKIARDGFTDEQAQWFISRRYAPKDDEFGAALTAKEAWKETARDYGVRLSDSVMNGWVQKMIGKQLNPDSFNDNIRDMAVSSNAYLRDAYAKGLTTREALAPFLSTASAVLGADQDTFDLSDEKWTRTMFDANGNQISDAAWRTVLKSDARFGYGNTKNGADEARRVGRNMARMMGVVGNG